MGISRRSFLGGIAGVAAVGGSSHQSVAAEPLATETISRPFKVGELRGSFSAADSGLRAGASDDQSRLLQQILDNAALQDKPVFLPPGNYVVSNINLPAKTRLIGVPGASRLVYSGAGHCLMAENCEHIEITGISVDGANRAIEGYAEGLIRVSNTSHLVIDNCEIVGSAAVGIFVDRSAGRIERNLVSGAGGLCAIYGVENRQMLISSNRVSDCANGGILVHRWKQGDDGTIVTSNQISDIDAKWGRYRPAGQWN